MPSIENRKKQAFWTRDSSIILGGFLVIVFLVAYIWWPLAESYFSRVDWNGAWWLYMDWLLIGVWLFMLTIILVHADIKTDLPLVLVGLCGGMAIESWGTQTNLWHYYTAERPPLWIIPAWAISNLAIHRITGFLNWIFEFAAARDSQTTNFPLFAILYWLTFITYLCLMFVFVFPTLDKSYTKLALILCILIICTPKDYRFAFLTFAAGAGLGYFLELWGTSRQCWIYYTCQKPPMFAVLAHGMAAVAFWRAGLLCRILWKKTGWLKHYDYS